MRTIVFDTETSGFRPGNICQLAYIIDDDGSITGRNYFFKVDYVEPGAERVHGFSVEALGALSGGQAFGTRARSICDDFIACPIWVAHNFYFDNSFLLAECKRNGIMIAAEQYFCTMRHYTPIMKLPPNPAKLGASQYKYPSLSELMAFIGVSDDETAELAGDLFDWGDSGLCRHDARFDCAATYLCYKKGAAIGHGPD